MKRTLALSDLPLGALDVGSKITPPPAPKSCAAGAICLSLSTCLDLPPSHPAATQGLRTDRVEVLDARHDADRHLAALCGRLRARVQRRAEPAARGRHAQPSTSCTDCGVGGRLQRRASVRSEFTGRNRKWNVRIAAPNQDFAADHVVR